MGKKKQKLLEESHMRLTQALHNLRVENIQLVRQVEPLKTQLAVIRKDNDRLKNAEQSLQSDRDHCFNEYQKLLNEKLARQERLANSVGAYERPDGAPEIWVNGVMVSNNYVLREKLEDSKRQVASLERSRERIQAMVADLKVKLADAKHTIKVLEGTKKSAVDGGDPDELSGSMARSWLKNVMAENERLRTQLGEKQ